MIKLTKPLSRRAMLRGAGAALALPALEAMAPRSLLANAPAKTAVRMAFFFFPNGQNMEGWRMPKAGGLPDTLAPLKSVASSVTVISGLKHTNGEGLGDGAGDHARDSAVYLTGAHPVKTAGKDIKAGVSADQFAAQQIGGETRLPSLELATEGGAQSGNCDSGYSCAYSSNISWMSPSTPMAKEVNPRNLFIRLFGDPKAKTSEQEVAREASSVRSILDLVLEDTRSLKPKLGVSDQSKIDEYLESVRSIERQIQAAEKASRSGPPPELAMPSGVPGSFEDHIRVMMDLVAAAFQTDTTRIITFMLANSGSNRTFPGIGVNEGHHTLSHHGSAKNKLDTIRKIDLFYMRQFAYLLEKMNAVKEEKGSLLDNSMLVYGGAISDGNRHNHDDLPVLLAGKGGGTIASGRNLKASGQPMCNLFLSLFDRMKVKAVQFGDSTKRLAL